ncbi:MAG TPA: BrnA antitoxin family protein [Bryobacteraceae bacterium]|nr:BrnA antitoxin family protein [Bryobacteraceae bacterium]
MKEKLIRVSGSRPLTAAQRREIAALAAMPDDTIDFSDIPELDEKFWANAVRNPFYKPVKKQLTVRLDSDVIAWLQRKGKGYQTRLNSILRGAMLKEQQSASQR